MTFNGSGMDDLHKILGEFPRSFTLLEVTDRFGWPTRRARQAVVNGQQTDTVRLVTEVRSPTGGTAHAVYENTQWRRNWLIKPWRQCG